MLTITSYTSYQGGILKEVIPGNLLYEHFQLAEMPCGLSSLLKSCWCLTPPGYEMIETTENGNKSNLSLSEDGPDGCIFSRMAKATSCDYASLASNPGGRLNLGNFINNEHNITDIFPNLSSSKTKGNKQTNKSNSKEQQQQQKKLKKIKETDKIKNTKDFNYQSCKIEQDNIIGDYNFQTKVISDLVVITKKPSHHRHRRQRSNVSHGALLTIQEEQYVNGCLTEPDTDTVESVIPFSDFE